MPVHSYDRGDLDPAGDQLEIFDHLLNALAMGENDPATFLHRLTSYGAYDRLRVARFWGGPTLQTELTQRFAGRAVSS